VVEAVLTRILVQESLHESATRVQREIKAASADKSEAKAIDIFPQSARKKRHIEVSSAGGKITSPVSEVPKNFDYLVEQGALR
jgi:hypothetical protein